MQKFHTTGTKVKIFGSDRVGKVSMTIVKNGGKRTTYIVKFLDGAEEEWPEEWLVPFDGCQTHTWTKYIGFTQMYDYCETCGDKKK